jgi:hypothetical protein
LFLEQLPTLAIAAGAHVVIENPLARMTKGEMFARTAELLGADAASALLSATHPCGHTGRTTNNCGCCERRGGVDSSDEKLALYG